MIPVKVCGITNLQDALTCVEHGVTALGFVFAESKRRVSPAAVAEITRRLPPFVTRVGVFVNEDPLIIKDILKDCHLDLVQLHGAESNVVAEILPGRVIKAFKAGYEQPDLSWKNVALRAVLIDTYSPSTAGGTGQAFDWNLFEDYRNLGFPLILAGGLNPSNVRQAITQTKADAVDLSSGVEREPGIKDPEKIKCLMMELRALSN